MKYSATAKLFSYAKYKLSHSDCSGWGTFPKVLLLCSLFSATTAHAENYPDLNDEGEFSLMGALSDLGWHDLQDERWNAYSQATYISSFKDAFPAAYTN